MSCKTENKQIGDHEYSVTQWPAEKAMTMKFRLTKVFGAAITSLAGNVGDNDADDEKQVMALSNGLSKLFDGNSPEEITELLKNCVVGVACDGKRITDASFNELFSGDDLIEVYKVFVFVVQVNYSNLLKGQLAERLAAIQEKL